MNIVTRLNDEQVKRDFGLGKEASFEIYWEHNGVAFPSEGWMDFGIVILGWWIVAIRKLRSRECSQQELLFMEGPYRLTISDTEGGLLISKSDGSQDSSWQSSMNELVDAVSSATDRVVLHMNQLGIYKTECEKLTSGLTAIR